MSEISYWFVSHTDTDHVSGLKEVLVSGYRVEYLVFAKAVEKEAKTKELAELTAAMERKCFICRRGYGKKQTCSHALSVSQSFG